MSDLKSKYYNPKEPSSFGGVTQLAKATKQKAKTIKKWLSHQDTYTLHRPARKKFKRRRVITGGIGYQYMADLVDMRKFSKWNDGMNYILMCIDVFSKFGFAVPVKSKKSTSIIPAFKKIFDAGIITPYTRLSFDCGGEFESKKMYDFYKKEGISHFSFRNETKAMVVERFNRTILTKLYRYFTHSNSYRYIEVLPKIIHAYNHSYHRSIKTYPANVSSENESEIWNTLHGDIIFDTFKEPNFKVGDHVRLSKISGPFTKSYSQRWTEEIFTISKRYLTVPPVYSVRDYRGIEIDGRFYEPQLQKVVKKDEYIIEEILGERRVKGRKEVLVKWLGYDKTYNSYIPKDHIKSVKER